MVPGIATYQLSHGCEDVTGDGTVGRPRTIFVEGWQRKASMHTPYWQVEEVGVSRFGG